MFPKFIQKIFSLFFAAFLACLCSNTYASTIAQIGTEDLVNRSELIFEGTVVAVETELNEFGRVYTYIDFAIEDVLAGSTDSANFITLRFTGGIAEGVELDLGVRIPKLNERGIYFVEKAAPGLINPLLGWEQGHFVIGESGAVVAANSLEVKSVEMRSRSISPTVSEGVALGINTRSLVEGDSEFDNEQSFQPMSVSDFKERIRELLN